MLLAALQIDLKSSALQTGKTFEAELFTMNEFSAVRDAVINQGALIEHAITKLSVAVNGPDMDGESCRGLCAHVFKSFDGFYKAIVVAKSCAVSSILADTLDSFSR